MRCFGAHWIWFSSTVVPCMPSPSSPPPSYKLSDRFCQKPSCNQQILRKQSFCCCLETLVFFQYPKHGFWVLKLTTYLILLLVRAYQSWSDLRSRHLPWLGCQMVVSLPSFLLKFAGFSLRKVLSNQENSCHSSHRKTSCHSKSSNLSCADWVYDCKTMISIDGASSDSVL